MPNRQSDWPEEFDLDGQPSSHQPDFELEIVEAEISPEPAQAELYLPESNPEQPDASPQLPLSEEMQPPRYAVTINEDHEVVFQHAASLLDSLEAQGVDVHYQCREGYCGSCRVQLQQGSVHYQKEPLAFIDEDEILPCCCIPKSALKIKL
jgi:ferredoxin